MAIELVRDFFKTYQMEQHILEFDVSSATVELAAAALGCEPGRIAKSLSFKVNEEAILIITAGDAKIDNSKYKNFFHTKAKMLTPDEVLTKIGHAVGGVCPFGINSNVIVYLDISLQQYATVFPACGSSNSAIELTIPQLDQYSNFKVWIHVCKERSELQ